MTTQLSSVYAVLGIFVFIGLMCLGIGIGMIFGWPGLFIGLGCSCLFVAMIFRARARDLKRGEP